MYSRTQIIYWASRISILNTLRACYAEMNTRQVDKAHECRNSAAAADESVIDGGR